MRKPIMKPKKVKLSKKRTLKKNKGSEHTRKNSKINKKHVTQKNKNNKTYTGGNNNISGIVYFTDDEVMQLDITTENGYNVVKYSDDKIAVYKKSDVQPYTVLYYINDSELKYVILDNRNNEPIKLSEIEKIKNLNINQNELKKIKNIMQFRKYIEIEKKFKLYNLKVKQKINTLIEELKSYVDPINRELKKKCRNLSLQLDYYYKQTNVIGKFNYLDLLLCLNKQNGDKSECVSILELNFGDDENIKINSIISDEQIDENYYKLLQCVTLKIFIEYIKKIYLEQNIELSYKSLYSTSLDPRTALLLLNSYYCEVKLHSASNNNKKIEKYGTLSDNYQYVIKKKVIPYLETINVKNNGIELVEIIVPFSQLNLHNANIILEELISTDLDEDKKKKQIKCE